MLFWTQIVLKDQHKAVLKLVRRNVEHAEEYDAQQQMPMEPHEDDHPEEIDENNEVVHIKLCSPCKRLYGLTLGMVEQEQSMVQPATFKDFRQKTLHFLETVYGLTTIVPSAENVISIHF
jgi:hypothetical protein